MIGRHTRGTSGSNSCRHRWRPARAYGVRDRGYELDREHGPPAALAGRPGGTAFPGRPSRLRGMARQRRPRRVRRPHVHRGGADHLRARLGERALRSPDPRNALRRARARVRGHHHRRPGGVASTRGSPPPARSDLRAGERTRGRRQRLAPQPQLHLQHIRGRQLEPLRARRLPRRRRGTRQGVQPAVPLRRCGSRQDPPHACHRSRRARDRIATRRSRTSRPRSS